VLSSKKFAYPCDGRDHNPEVSSQRQFPRYAHEAELTLTSGATRYMGRTSNLSRGGICAVMTAPIRVGTSGELEVALVFAEGELSESLRMHARVVWCTALEQHHQVGLSFGGLDAEQLKFLEMFLRFLDEGAQQRRAAGGGRRGPFDR
jgi:hypothetical protein